MVLHNDKWKRKAKWAVEKKHRAQGKGTLNKSADSDKAPHDENDENDENDGSDEDYEHDEDEENARFGNSWRFADPVVDESILKDPEYQAQIQAKQREEEERSRYMRELVSSKVQGKPEENLETMKQVKSFKEMRKKGLSNLKFGSDSESGSEDEDGDGESNSQLGEPIVREFTDSEKAKFLALQEKIRHQKEVDLLKAKINKVNHKGTAKVLEIHTEKGKDNYRHLVDAKLHQMTENKDDLDELVGQMLGIDLKNAKVDETPHEGTFDLDNVIGNVPSNVTRHPSRSKGTVVPVKLEEADEDFLDSLI